MVRFAQMHIKAGVYLDFLPRGDLHSLRGTSLGSRRGSEYKCDDY